MQEFFMNINWTPIVVAVIGIFGCAIVGLISKYAVPWLKEHNLVQCAQVAVMAAEAIYGRYNGGEKLKKALETLKNKGWDISSAEVIDAVNAAWKQLDLEMIEWLEYEIKKAGLH